MRAAVQFLRQQGAALGVDADRIGLIGDSAGAHLAAMAALAGDTAPLRGLYADDPYAALSPAVKVFIGIYSVYDLAAQWSYDQQFHADDNISEVFLGARPDGAAQRYADASPLSYAAQPPAATAFLLGWVTADGRVAPRHQSAALAAALKRSGASVQTVVFKGAPHYWMSDAIRPGSYPPRLAPVLLDFLRAHL